jgi:hypothetical protein
LKRSSSLATWGFCLEDGDCEYRLSMVSESAGKVDLYFTQKEGNEYSETAVFFQVFDTFYRDKNSDYFLIFYLFF